MPLINPFIAQVARGLDPDVRKLLGLPAVNPLRRRHRYAANPLAPFAKVKVQKGGLVYVYSDSLVVARADDVAAFLAEGLWAPYIETLVVGRYAVLPERFMAFSVAGDSVSCYVVNVAGGARVYKEWRPKRKAVVLTVEAEKLGRPARFSVKEVDCGPPTPRMPVVKPRAEEYTASEIASVTAAAGSENVQRMMQHIRLDTRFGVAGPRGAGKTFAIRAAVARTSLPYIYIHYDWGAGGIAARCGYGSRERPCRVEPSTLRRAASGIVVLDDLHYVLPVDPGAYLEYIDALLSNESRTVRWVLVSDDDPVAVLMRHGAYEEAYRVHTELPVYYVDPSPNPYTAAAILGYFHPQWPLSFAAAIVLGLRGGYRDVVEAATLDAETLAGNVARWACITFSCIS